MHEVMQHLAPEALAPQEARGESDARHGPPATPLWEGTFHSVVKEIKQSVRLQHTPFGRHFPQCG